MNKKVTVGIVVIIIIAILGFFVYFLLNNDDKTSETKKDTPNNSGINDTNDIDNKIPSSNGKTLVVYYSATGSTKEVAEQISKNLDANIFEIVPENIYTSADLNWNNENSRVSREHNDESLRNIKLKNTQVDDWESYDTILIGYPIWWGIAAWPVDTFVKENDFTGKTVIPFCTSASSGLGQSGKLLEQEANGGNWLERHRFSSGASNTDIKKWTDSLK